MRRKLFKVTLVRKTTVYTYTTRPAIAQFMAAHCTRYDPDLYTDEHACINPEPVVSSDQVKDEHMGLIPYSSDDLDLTVAEFLHELEQDQKDAEQQTEFPFHT